MGLSGTKGRVVAAIIAAEYLGVFCLFMFPPPSPAPTRHEFQLAAVRVWMLRPDARRAARAQPKSTADAL